MNNNKTIQSFLDTRHICLQMRAQPAYLRVARMAVSQVVKNLEMDEKDCEIMVLAIEEAMTNVIRHSYGGPCNKPIILEISTIVCDNDEKNKALEIVIRDYGKQVDPETIKGRDLEDIKPGGLGVHIIRSVMDQCQYSKVADGGMQLRLVKYLTKQQDIKE